MFNSIVKTEMLESRELPDSSGYKDIKPESTLTMDETHSFWDEVFGKEPLFLAEKLSGEDMWNEIFSREEGDFKFDFDIQEKKLQELLDGFGENKWSELSEAKMVETIENFLAYLSELLGIENIPTVNFFEDDENICGTFNQQTNTIDINRNTLHNPKEVVDTLAHELRHAYQHHRAAIFETDTDKLYAFNFENYISPSMVDNHYIFFWDYQEQFVETEARAFANLFKS